MRRLFGFLVLFYIIFPVCVEAQSTVSVNLKGWKAGVSRVVITPKQSMAMAGFASRTRPSEGTLHDLWAKALVIEDTEGKQAVLVTTDLLGLPKKISDNIRERLRVKFGLTKDRVILNSSHTHSGPVLEDALSDIYVLDAVQLDKIKRYSRELEDQIVNLVGDALRKKEPVELYAQNGVTRFQVNRRNNPAGLIPQLSELQGPNDFAVPVIKVVNGKGVLMAVAFGYACHPTVLDGYKWSGDYVGFAQIELEKAHPGVTALFFQGAGADQNPLPRHTVPLAKQYGRELAAAVERVLEEDMRKLPAKLSTSYSEVSLPLAAAPTEEELSKMIQNTPANYQRRWAERLLSEVKAGKSFSKSYLYPVQVWSLGDLSLVSLGGELAIEYSIKIKQMLGQETFVLGYSNDVMGYIPTSTILKEGGYEGDSSQMVYGLPAKWDPTIETRILNEVVNQAAKAGVLISAK